MPEVARIYPLQRQSASRRPEPHRPEPQRPEPHRPEPLRSPESRRPEPQRPEPLWREVLGRRLRAIRAEREETLAETADRAGISPQYLSEVERGRKEPSSEMIAALAGALDTTLADLTTQVTDDLRQSAALALGRSANRPAAASDLFAMAA